MGCERRTSTALEGTREQLKDPTHLLYLLDDATSDENGADLDRGREDLGVRVGGESLRRSERSL